MTYPVSLRKQLGIVIHLADRGLTHRDDMRDKSNCIADAVIEWLAKANFDWRQADWDYPDDPNRS